MLVSRRKLVKSWLLLHNKLLFLLLARRQPDQIRVEYCYWKGKRWAGVSRLVLLLLLVGQTIRVGISLLDATACWVWITGCASSHLFLSSRVANPRNPCCCWNVTRLCSFRLTHFSSPQNAVLFFLSLWVEWNVSWFSIKSIPSPQNAVPSFLSLWLEWSIRETRLSCMLTGSVWNSKSAPLLVCQPDRTSTCS